VVDTVTNTTSFLGTNRSLNSVSTLDPSAKPPPVDVNHHRRFPARPGVKTFRLKAVLAVGLLGQFLSGRAGRR